MRRLDGRRTDAVPALYEPTADTVKSIAKSRDDDRNADSITNVGITGKICPRTCARRTGRGIEPGGASYYYAVDLDRRYGKLPPGRYTLTVRHPHPETAATLISNPISFDARDVMR